MNTLFGDSIVKSAVISECGRYRYSLTRIWDRDVPPVVWVMLNPSTADAEQDDPTIRRCIGFTKAWGCGGIVVVNLYAWRATYPRELTMVSDPVGPSNDTVIRELSDRRLVVAAWGVDADLGRKGREAEVLKILDRPYTGVYCLGTTKHGKPRHPLYVKGDQALIPYGASA